MSLYFIGKVRDLLSRGDEAGFRIGLKRTTTLWMMGQRIDDDLSAGKHRSRSEP